MNYHLLIDEKFIDGFISDAEKYAPGNNTYLVSLYTQKPIFTTSHLITYVKSVKKYWFSQIAPNLKITDKVFIHWLDRRVYDIILSLPQEIKVGIFSWMGDLIATPSYLFEKEILKPNSYAFFNRYKKYKFEKDPSHGYIYNFLLFGRHVYRIMTSSFEWSKKKKVMQRVDLFFHWNELDYQWVKNHYHGFSAEFVYFVYDVGLETEISVLTDERKKEQLVIWLGNSATLSNNHFEALDDLAHLRKANIEILCPLSYGEKVDSKYIKQLLKKGKQVFGNKFVPLLSYLDRNEYYALFNKVDIVVMNHVRSQAAGNIFAFLQFGKVIFMDKKSTLYQFLFSKKTENLYSMEVLQKLSFNGIQELIDLKSENKSMKSILDFDIKVSNLRKHLN